MDMIDHFSRLFAYDQWANGETVASLVASTSPPSKSLRLLAHIVAAERLWLSRLQADGKAVVVWPDLNLHECTAQLAELGRIWEEELRGLTPARLAQPIAYTNTKGEQWTNTAGEILTHVVLHSAYHRGQIASDIRAAGLTPAGTDFIHGVRQGLVE
jgi:uncharacterized damage-inducible protein DinB